MARTLEDISTQNEDSPQGGSGEVCQKASKDLSDILLGDDILQRLKQGEEVIREGLIFEFDSSAYFNDIIIKYNDKDFTLFVSNLKGISLKEIKRRIELLVKLETYGVLLDYAYGVIDMYDPQWSILGDLKRTKELEEILLKRIKNKKPTTILSLVIGYPQLIKYNK